MKHFVVLIAITGSFPACSQSGEDPEDPVIQASADDPRLIEATEEARRRWDEFARAFKNHKPGWAFNVKLEFSDSDGEVEYLWILVDKIDGDQVSGTVNNSPVIDLDIALGDRVTCQKDEIFDWVYSYGAEQMVGGFSIEVLAEIERERSAG